MKRKIQINTLLTIIFFTIELKQIGNYSKISSYQFGETKAKGTQLIQTHQHYRYDS